MYRRHLSEWPLRRSLFPKGNKGRAHLPRFRILQREDLLQQRQRTGGQVDKSDKRARRLLRRVQTLRAHQDARKRQVFNSVPVQSERQRGGRGRDGGHEADRQAAAHEAGAGLPERRDSDHSVHLPPECGRDARRV